MRPPVVGGRIEPMGNEYFYGFSVSPDLVHVSTANRWIWTEGHGFEFILKSTETAGSEMTLPLRDNLILLFTKPLVSYILLDLPHPDTL